MKLLARSTKGVLLRRGLFLSVFADGADGVAEILRLLNREMKRSVVLAECRGVTSFTDEIPISR